MNLAQANDFVETGQIPSYFMGPNDTIMDAKASYVLGVKEADMVIVLDTFINGNKRKSDKLRDLVCRGRYRFTNAITDSFAMSIPPDLVETATPILTQAKAAMASRPDFAGKDATLLCMAGPNNYDDPFLLKRFRNRTYCWNEKREMWCFVLTDKPTIEEHMGGQ